MTIVELIRAFGRDLPTGILITDAVIKRPGPIIVYANPAFSRLVGRDLDEIIGLSPRFMQGRETRRSTLDAFHHALKGGKRFHGYLTNYRGDGTKYRVEIDCRPVRGPDGRIQYYMSFEREVVRREHDEDRLRDATQEEDGEGMDAAPPRGLVGVRRPKP